MAFSCKARSCPSCNARRMEDAANHLVHDIFPRVPVRQWVLSFPRRIRLLAARDPAFCSGLLDLFTRAVFAWQRRRGRLVGVSDPRTGGCTVVQRFGSATNLNVRLHTLIRDGVFDVARPGRAVLVPLPAPSNEDLRRIQTIIIRKGARHLRGDEDVECAIDEVAFAEPQAAEVDRRSQFPDPFKHALQRLSQVPDGNLLYKLKRFRSGAHFLLLTPDQLLARIATLVPPPRTHAQRYHGVFAPNAGDRERVVSGGGGPLADHSQHRPFQPTMVKGGAPPVASGPCTSSPPPDRPLPERLGPRYRIPWADLLRKVFPLDVLDCPQCGGRMELIAFIAEARVAERILDHLGPVSTGPPVAKPSVADEALGPGPVYDGAEAIYDD